MATARVGMQEFRENLASYVELAAPLAITRRGETIGFFVPALREPDRAGVAALARAGELLRAMLATSGAGEDELMSEVKVSRKAPRAER